MITLYGLYAQRAPNSFAAMPASVATGAATIAVARSRGSSWADLGLDSDNVGAGVRVGFLALAPIAAVVATGATLPATRHMFADQRVTGLADREALYELLVRIPLVTALTEEILFRGVLLGIASELMDPLRAVATTSALFGVWHVLPAMEAHRTNAGLAEQVGSPVGTVLATVAATGAAGAAFCWLRRKSGSVLAPLIAHAGLNGLSFIAARLTK